MRKRIWNLIALMMMAAVIFGVIQLNTPVARSAGCPNAGTVGCNCYFMYSTSAVEPDGHITWRCHYSCTMCESGSDPMYIEQVVEVRD
jgi:hypothetical protein